MVEKNPFLISWKPIFLEKGNYSTDLLLMWPSCESKMLEQVEKCSTIHFESKRQKAHYDILCKMHGRKLRRQWFRSRLILTIAEYSWLCPMNLSDKCGPQCNHLLSKVSCPLYTSWWNSYPWIELHQNLVATVIVIKGLVSTLILLAYKHQPAAGVLRMLGAYSTVLGARGRQSV